MRKNVLITGSSGFIGQALADHLRGQKTYQVWGIDPRRLEEPGMDFLKIDLLDQKKVVRSLCQRRPRIIFHLAGGRPAGPMAMFTANVRSTLALFDAISRIRGYRPRVFVMGSAAEYGSGFGRTLVTEEMSGQVEGAYGLCKRAQTQVALCFSSAGNDVVVARLFNILGPGIPVATAGGKFAQDIVRLEGRPGGGIIPCGPLGAVRDFLDVRDICEAVRLIAEHGPSGEVYNICSQKGVGMRDLLKKMLALSRSPGLKFQESSGRDAGVRSLVGSCAKLKKETAWRQRYTLEQSLQDTLEYYRKSGGPC